jgi:hypothetical protein
VGDLQNSQISHNVRMNYDYLLRLLICLRTDAQSPDKHNLALLYCIWTRAVPRLMKVYKGQQELSLWFALRNICSRSILVFGCSESLFHRFNHVIDHTVGLERQVFEA